MIPITTLITIHQTMKTMATRVFITLLNVAMEREKEDENNTTIHAE
jgi:hypothetical protein